MDDLHVIVLNDYAFINGGASQVAITSSIALAKAGVKVSFFAAVGPVAVELEECEGLTIYCLNQYDILTEPNRIWAGLMGLWNFRAYSMLANILSKENQQKTIIHIHSISKALTASVAKCIFELNFSVIYHLHDYGMVCPNLGLYNYQSQKICKLKPMSTNCFKTHCDSRKYVHKLWRYVRQSIQNGIGNIPIKLRYFIAVSDFSKDIVKQYLTDEAEIYRINNPIDISLLNAAYPAANTRYVFVGRLTPEKDPMLFAMAARELGVRATFIGDGVCADLIKEIYPDAELLGWLPYHETQNIIRQSRALVMTSRCYETQGMVVSEAIAHGIPAVVPDTCAARDFITDQKTGLIYQAGNVSSLISVLQRLNNDQFVRTLGDNGYSQYWDNPSTLEEYVDKIIPVYESILEDRIST